MTDARQILDRLRPLVLAAVLNRRPDFVNNELNIINRMGDGFDRNYAIMPRAISGP